MSKWITVLLVFISVALVPKNAFAQQELPIEVNGSGKTEFMKDPNNGKQGKDPFLRAALTKSQMERTKKIHLALKEVDPSSLQDWIDDFRRDKNPDSEIAVWEAIVGGYQGYTSAKKLPLPAKDEVLQILLMRSGASEPLVLKHFRFHYVSPKEARKIMNFYKIAPKPITVKTKS